MTASTATFIESIPPLFRQPVALGFVASLGLHGLFAANVQYINFYSKSIKLPSAVQVVELSPEQINRVYPAPPPKLSFTPLKSLSPSLSILPIPSSDNIILPPAPEDFMSVESIPSWPTNIPLPPPSNSPNFPTYRLPPVMSQGPNSNPLNSGSIGFLPNSNPSLSFVPGPPLSFDNPPPPPPPEQPGQLKPPGSLPSNNELALRQQLIRDLGQDVECPPMFNNPNCTPSAPNQNNNNTNTSPNPSPPPANTPNVQPQPSNPKGSILAGLEKGLQQQPPNPTPNPPEGVVNEQQTAMLQGGGSYLNWVNGLLSNYPNLETTSPIAVKGLYPPSVCEQKLTGKALVGVVVGEQGEILQEPELLLATDYPVLNDAAKTAVREMAFEPTNVPKAYQIQFQFNAEENCKAVNNQTPEPTNAPATSPSPTSETEQPANPTQQNPSEPQPESNP